MSSTVPTPLEPSGSPGFPQLAGNVLIKYQGSCLKNYFSLPLSELVLVLSQFEKKKNHKLVVGLFLPHSFLKLLKSKNVFENNAGKWFVEDCLSPGWFILPFAFFSRLV